MNTKLLSLFFSQILFFVCAFGQNISPKYAIINNSQLNVLKISGAGYIGPYNSDSSYISFNQTTPQSEVIKSLIKPISRFQKINYQWQTLDSIQTITVNFFNTSDLFNFVNFIKNKAIEAEWQYNRLPFMSTIIKINKKNIETILNLETVKYITYKTPAVQAINFVERTNHRVSQFAPNFPTSSYLTGKGIILAEWDGGDIGIHIDFADRLTVVKKLGINSHATHVGGTMAGAGNLEPAARGMAPASPIFSWDFYGDIPLEMDTCKPKFGYVLTQNSYGYWTNNCIDFALYDQTSTDMDKLSIKFPDLLHVFAAGNSRGMNCVSGGYKTILPGFQSAKNTISVAAITSADGDASFSCAGPTQDGRFKPEISAVGVNVYSTQNNNTYSGGWNGTSMACPGASGTIALLYERFKAKYGYIPPNFLGKNIISNTADDIGNAGPDYKYGFGRINGRVAVNLIDSGFWAIDSIAANGNCYDTVYIPKNLNDFKVMLTWNDKEVNNTGGQILVNDLDLILIDSTGASYNAWWCNPSSPSSLAVRKRDSINNMEQITFSNPPSGKYIIRVNGKKIASGNQTFAITYSKEPKAITVMYPNGRETMEAPSNTAKAKTIRWDSKGISGTYSIDFSRDNGSTWTNITSGIPNNQNYFNWQTLSDTVSTGKALIRVSNGNVADVSDSTFNITSLVSVSSIATTVCDSQVFLKWNSVPKTNFYRVYLLKNGKMTEMGTTKDTSFVITKLNNNIASWFSISRKASNGAESERTLAISATPNNTNIPPRITLQPKDIATCYTNNYFVKSKATGTNPITHKWEFSRNDGTTWNTIPNANDSINLKTYLTDYSFKVRRTYSNVCLAPVYTRIASIQADSLLDIKFYNKDTTICLGSIYNDSVKVKSKLPATVTWYSDSLTFSNELQKGLNTKYSNKIKYPMSIWAKVENLCGTIVTRDLSKIPKLNGRNDYTIFAKPTITIADTLLACIGENFTISPLLSGGKPGAQKLIITTKDSASIRNNITLKITQNQTVKLEYFDKCNPDTTTKIIYIKMRKPLQVNLNNDSTICYNNTASLRAIASGGNGNYTYTWSDIGTGSKNRNTTLTNSKKINITLTDNCTEKSVTDSISIAVLPALNYQLTANKDTLCSGTILQLNLNPSGGRTTSHAIVWKNNGLSGYSPSLIPKKSDWYVAALSDGCSPTKTDSIYIVRRNPLTIKISTIDTLCHNKLINLTAQYSGGLPNKETIEWQPINQFGNNVNYNPTITQNIIAKLSDGCTIPSVYDTLKVNVYNPLVLQTLPDTQTCFGKALKLKINSTGGKTNTQKYYWQNIKIQSFSIDSFNTKIYNYAVADACKDSISKLVKVNVTPQLALSPASIYKCSYNNLPVVFNANTLLPTTITWNNLPAGKNQLLKDKLSTTYIATINDGCSDTSTQTIKVNISDFTSNNFNIESVISKTAHLRFSVLNKFKNYIQWDGSYKTIETSTDAYYTYNQYGIYNICKILEDSISCTDTICKTYDNSDPIGFTNFTFKIFPNPVNKELNFLLNQLVKNLSVEIIDAAGKVVYSDKQQYPAYTLFTINTDLLSSGVYMIKVNANNEIFTEKFLKVE